MPATTALRLGTVLVALLGALVVSSGLALAEDASGLTTKRVVIKDAAGAIVDTFREKQTTPVTWERRKHGGFWRPVKVLDRTKHVLWFYDPADALELRVEFPETSVRTRAASKAFPNPNTWRARDQAVSVFTTPGVDRDERVTGLNVRRFTLEDASGLVVGVYRERAPAATPPTWEAQDPGQAWRGPIRVVDRSEHDLWLFDEADNAELRVEFPTMRVKSRPGSKQFPNPTPWTNLPLKAKAFTAREEATASSGSAERVTFHVVNAFGAPVELFQPKNWPHAGSEGVLVDVIRPGQTRTYTADANLGWVIRRASGSKVEIRRFKITRENQRIVVERDGGPKPPPSPLPVPKPVRTETLSITAPVVLLGGWKHVNGDPDMDTDGRDRVPVQVKSRLSFSADGVYVDVYFRCQEYRGDGTTYGGHWSTVELVTKAGGKIPSDARVVGIKPRGGAGEREWSVVSVGKQHQLQRLDTRNTYWDDLFFLVDHPRRGDGAHVGVRGTITLNVVVER